MDNSKIEWTDATWNPLRGCSRVSEGCRNCYAERVAARFSWPNEDAMVGGSSLEGRSGGPYAGLAKMTKDGPRWTGKVSLIEEKLAEPLRWKRPRRIFVNSMGDLFHESVPFEWIDRIFAVMLIASEPRWMCCGKHDCEAANCPRVRGDESYAHLPHTFQVLTKRPERMLAYFDKDRYPWCGIEEQVERMGYGEMLEAADLSAGFLKNVWLGVSVEDQSSADTRIPLLLKTPAAVRWISAEPLLGPLDVTRYFEVLKGGPYFSGLDWIVVGGESGPDARPFCIDWADDIVRQARTGGVPVFVKQLGSKPTTENVNRWDMDAPTIAYMRGAAGGEYKLRDRKGGDMAEWPEALRVREFPQTGK